MSYFDFHLHHFFKHFLTGADEANRVNLNKEVGACVSLPEIGFILTSQSAPFQSEIPDAILCSSFVPLERGFPKQKLIKDVAPKITRLDRAFMTAIAESRISYWNLLQLELDYGLSSFKTMFPNYQLLNENKPTPDPGKTGIVFSVEGGHAFLKETGSASENLILLKKRAKQEGFCLLYSILTHLTRIDEVNGQQELATFSYGMKMIKDKVFHPRQKGISQEGLRFIDAAYSVREQLAPMLIDIKHMSLYSRKQFYAYRKEHPELINLNGNNFKTIPIIGSHCGVTGISWKKFADEVLSAEKEGDAVAVRIARPKAGNNPRKAWFNPWSINLFDEDILTIVESGGLIGISVDQRVLGFESLLGKVTGSTFKLFGEEYLSKEEFEELGVEVDELAERMSAHVEAVKDEQVLSDQAKEALFIGEQEFNKRLHTYYFCYNLLHILNVAFQHYCELNQGDDNDAIDKAWSHVCIGSDFDGLIDPINSFRNITEWKDFERRLKKHLEDARDYYVKERNNIHLPIKGKKKDISEYINQLLFTNGKNFVQKWLSNKIAPSPLKDDAGDAGNFVSSKSNVIA